MEQKFSSLGVMEAADHSKNSAVEAENHVKHGASSKSLMSRANFLRIICMALFAAVFVFSGCDNDDENNDDNNGNGSGSGNINTFTINAPVTGGNANIASVKLVAWEGFDADTYVELKPASFSNNTLVLELPKNVPAGVLFPVSDHWGGLNISPNSAKMALASIIGYKGNEDEFGAFEYVSENETWWGTLVFVDRNVSVTGTINAENFTIVHNLSLKKGWNWYYFSEVYDEDKGTWSGIETSTAPSGINLKWIFYIWD